MRPGVSVESSKNVKDELHISGIVSRTRWIQDANALQSLADVSQSAADIQQICRVRNKDIRKFLDGIYVSERGHMQEE